jgi:hypothetical protein
LTPPPLLRIGALVVASTLLSCSYQTTFFVANASSSPLRVVAALDPQLVGAEWCLLEPGKFFLGPAIVEPLAMKNWKSARIDRNAIQFNPATCSIELVLLPGMALALWSASGYTATGDAITFPTSLQVSGPNTRFNYQGVHLDTLFTRDSREVATLTFF